MKKEKFRISGWRESLLRNFLQKGIQSNGQFFGTEQIQMVVVRKNLHGVVVFPVFIFVQHVKIAFLAGKGIDKIQQDFGVFEGWSVTPPRPV
ncbi:hypothetical protein SAMN02745108_00696 [Fibrobacter intestinalis]|uniref:Uncharacterized protein n=1 Tax=Fibrobacter intestinalis TaxID=28122 RepID=A0A1T4KZ18_9BACT|nr:hypothetical protein BGW94_0187 [Fibrobacter sp. NR9]SJZ47621.1 hypothetical protein SAMN02745108_00696 [Fibrobacter intestinalis]